MKKAKEIFEKLTRWELWPFALIYAPLGPLWLLLAAKAKSFWWFSPANPTLTFAGFDGEGKREMYEQLPAELYPRTIYIKPSLPFDDVKRLVEESGLTYPICVKPDVGLKGLLFRKIDSEEKLQAYHKRMPIDYLIQELSQAPLEVSVFYYRHPAEERGVISGFIQKDMLHIIGDGKHTLLDLITQHPKAKHRLIEMCVKHEVMLNKVLPAGEKYVLAHAANLNRGATFTNLQSQIDERLLSIFDPLSQRCQWYYGRYDIKCDSIEELKAGKFIILEFNGAGAEPNHVYTAGYSWPAALKVFAHHWKMLYRIGKYNHQHNGVRYWGTKEGRDWMKAATEHGKLLQQLDNEILI